MPELGSNSSGAPDGLRPWSTQEVAEHLTERRVVAAVTLVGGDDVALGVEVNPRNRVTGCLGDLAEKRALGAPVALAEGWTALISA